jgi:hypothetical protein
MRPRLFVPAICLIGGLVNFVKAADPIAWLPSEINAVARINVAEIYGTPLAKKEDWLKKSKTSFVQQEGFVPPGTQQILMGAELDLTEDLTANRTYSVLVPDSNLTLEKLSLVLSSPIETVSGKKLAQYGNDSYVLDAGDGSWLTMSSGNRQSILRWFRSGASIKPDGLQLSPYLRTALTSKENSAPVILAVDLQDNFTAAKIDAYLKDKVWLSSLSIDNVTKTLESIQGITIGISVDAERTGFARLDFERDPVPLKPALEKFIDDVIQRIGISSEDILEWKWSIKGHQIVGSGPLLPGAARRLLAVLEPPSITQAISASSSTEKMSPEELKATASHKYCKSLQILLDDLRLRLRRDKGEEAKNLVRYARKIDDFPKLNVDSQLLDFGFKVSSSFRYQGQSQKVYSMQAGSAAARDSTYYYGGNAVGYSAAASYITLDDGKKAGKSVIFSEWKGIEDGLAAVRRAMTEKYKIEF